MKVFVTGACGEIGTRLVHLLLDAHHSVIAFDIKPAPPPDAAPLRENLTYIHGDARSYESVVLAMKGCDAVVHLAALIPTGFGNTDGIDVIHNTNVVMSWNVLRAAAELGITRVAQGSSINAMGAIYNKQVRVKYFPVDEKHPCEPDEGYGLSKQICEAQADALIRRFPSMRIASLRPHWCIPNTDPFPAQLLPHAPTKWQTVTLPEVLDAPDSNIHLQLWGWNTYNAIARAFFQAVTFDNPEWVTGHEVFFIVSSRIGSRRHPKEVIKEWFPNAEVRKEFGEEEGLYDCSKAERLLGWKHDV